MFDIKLQGDLSHSGKMKYFITLVRYTVLLDHITTFFFKVTKWLALQKAR